jgi:anti-sigma factor RsiW
VHPSDATLLALIHGELTDGAAVKRLRSHLADCAECAALEAELRAGDAEVRGLLAVLDHPVPERKPPVAAARGTSLRRAALAASLALLLAGGAAAAVPGTPLNRWIRERVAPAAPPAGHPAAPVPAGSTRNDGQAAGGVEIPATSELTLVFGESEPAGRLTVVTADRPDVSLRAFGGAVAYQVGEGRIVVDNRRPAARYALEVPRELTRLTVLVGGRLVFDSDRRPLGATTGDTVSLSVEPAR